MVAAAEEAADLYNADLALPLRERELTAFTACDSGEWSSGVRRAGDAADSYQQDLR
jgi:hypothetical protein